MAKKAKAIVPFFQIRGQLTDTLEVLAEELVRTIATIEDAVQLDPKMNAGIKQKLAERAEALRKVCMSED